MHELRKDPILNRWVAVLKDSKPPAYYLERGHKKHTEHGTGDNNCPLCHNKKDAALQEIFSIREESHAPGEPGWQTRVIPKPNPFFQVEGDLGRKGVGMYDTMNSIGANEIIIESPQHNTAPEEIGIAQMVRVIKTYRHRLIELEKDPRLRYTLIYKTCGEMAGQIYQHPYSQVIATPVIPKGVKEELDGAKAYYHYKERCIFCDIINEELRTEKRIIMETGNLVAFMPFAPRYPFEYWILPKRHNCAFQDINDEELEDLALMLMTTLNKMKAVLKSPAYNYVIHTSPNRIPRKDHWHTLGDDFHWHIEVMPQLTIKSGFEVDSDFYILTTSPEDAAKFFKEV